MLKTHEFVSIIIPAFNEAQYIGKCLDSILKLDTPVECYEVIVVDNGSNDGTRDIAFTFNDRLNLQILMKEDANISTLRNIGVAHSKGDVLAFLDADCTVSRKWLSNALKYFDDPAIGAVGSSHLTPEEYSWVAKTWDLNLAIKRKQGETRTLPSGNMFVSREKFLNINGFNDALSTNEDFDLCFRLIESGCRLYSDPEVSAVHFGAPNDLGSFYRQSRWHGQHVLKVFGKNLKKMNNFRAVAYSFYFLCFLSLLAVSLLTLLIKQNYAFFLGSIFALIAPPFLLSLKTISTQNYSYKYLIKLSLLFFVYGIARAHSVLDTFCKRGKTGCL